MIADLDALDLLVGKEKAFLPETGGGLGRLLAALCVIVDRNLPRDRALLTTDLETLVKGFSEVVALRVAGQDLESIDRLMIDLLALLSAMRQRAAKAIDNAVTEVSLPVALAVEDIGPAGKPLDLSREFRRIAAAPAPESEGAGQVIRTGFRPGEGAIGSLSGPFCLLAQNPALKVAPADAVLLPAGAVLRLAAGDSIMLHVRGRATRGVPASHDFARLRVLAQGDLVLHGPAILSPDDLPDRAPVLALRNRLQEAINVIPDEGGELLALGMGMVAAVTGAFMLLDGIAAFLLAAPVLPAGFFVGRSILRKDADMRSMVQGLLDDPLLQRLARMMKVNLARDESVLSHRWSFRTLVTGIGAFLETRDSLSFFPADLIHVHDGQMRVMEPLKALPAPLSQGNVVPLSAPRRA